MARRIATVEEMIDLLSSVKGGTFCTIGYLSGAKIGKTLTGKNVNVEKFGKDLDDYRMEGDDEIYNTLKGYQQRGASGKNKFPYGGIVKFATYSFHFQTEELYGKNNHEYTQKRDALLKKYGAEIQRREKPHDERIGYGNGVSVGATEKTKDKLYTHQNGATIQNYDEEYYVVDKDGELVGGISGDAIKSLISKSEPDGVSAMRKVNATDEQIKEYLEELKKLKFRILKLMYNSILFIVAKINGEKVFFINTKLPKQVGSSNYVVNINPESFIEKANDLYNKTIRKMGNETNESVMAYRALKRKIDESVRRAIMGNMIY